MKIYTKTGDKGSTSLLGGARVSKADQRINAYGTIDELNCHVGLVADQEVNATRLELLRHIQNQLFSIGSLLAAAPDKEIKYLPQLEASEVSLLEEEMDKMNELLPEMKNFILPGGNQAVSYCHLARVVCRRAEREVVLLSQQEKVADVVIVYLNRLSDYFFVLARKMAHELGIQEVIWKGKR